MYKLNQKYLVKNRKNNEQQFVGIVTDTDEYAWTIELKIVENSIINGPITDNNNKVKESGDIGEFSTLLWDFVLLAPAVAAGGTKKRKRNVKKNKKSKTIILKNNTERSRNKTIKLNK